MFHCSGPSAVIHSKMHLLCNTMHLRYSTMCPPCCRMHPLYCTVHPPYDMMCPPCNSMGYLLGQLVSRQIMVSSQVPVTWSYHCAVVIASLQLSYGTFAVVRHYCAVLSFPVKVRSNPVKVRSKNNISRHATTLQSSGSTGITVGTYPWKRVQLTSKVQEAQGAG